MSSYNSDADAESEADRSRSSTLSQSVPLTDSITASAHGHDIVDTSRRNPFNRDFCMSLPISTGDHFLPSEQLTENHFAVQRPVASICSIPELESSIRLCTEQLQAVDCTPTRRQQVCDRLVQLRLRVHTLRSGEPGDDGDAENATASVEVILGHHMRLKTGKCDSLCERCQGYVWGRFKAFYQCVQPGCGLVVHSGACMASMVRSCVVAEMEQGFLFLNKTQPFVAASLRRQQYACAECSKQIRVDVNDSSLENSNKSVAAARLCYYTGKYYCWTCHWDERVVLPAFVLRFADIQAKPVCRRAKQILNLLRPRALIDVESVEAAWFLHCAGLHPAQHPASLTSFPPPHPPAERAEENVIFPRFAAVHKMRLRIRVAVDFLTSCAHAKQLRLLKQLSDISRGHFVESSSVYSLLDLEETCCSDTLHDVVQNILLSMEQHIAKCDLCQCRVTAASKNSAIPNQGQTQLQQQLERALATESLAVWERQFAAGQDPNLTESEE